MRMRGLWVLVLLLGLAQIALLARGAAAQEEDGDGGERGQGPGRQRMLGSPAGGGGAAPALGAAGSPGWRAPLGLGCSSQAPVHGAEPAPRRR